MSVRIKTLTNPINVILVDTGETLPDDLSTILTAPSEISILGKTNASRHGLLLVHQLKPTIVILGLPVLDKSAIKILKRLSASSLKPRTIIVAPTFVESHVAAVFDAGCAGFVSRERYATDLIRAVLAVTVGRHFLGYPLFERVIEAYLAYGYSSFENFPDLIPDFPN
jgi:DNA-binding NarL/FixJ family response regulator